MNCAEVESLFDALLDGELSGSLRLEFDAHRLRCRACQQRLALLEAAEHTLSTDLDVWTPSARFTDGVMERIAQDGVRPRQPAARRWLTPVTAALPAAAALLLAAGLWLRSGPSASPGPLPGPTAIDGITLAAEAPRADLYRGLWRPVEQVQAATVTMRDEFSWLGRYAQSLQSSLAGDATPINPVQGLLNVLLFGAPDSLETGGGSPDEASL